MTGNKPVDDELRKKLGTITLRFAEIVHRVGKSLDPDSVSEDLQMISDGASGDPVERFLLRELRLHWRFFGIAFDLSNFAETLKKYLPKPEEKDYGWNNQVKKWKNLGFEIHFLPKIGVFTDVAPLGLKSMPPVEYFALIGRGDILRKDWDGTLSLAQSGLEGKTVLIDTAIMPLDFQATETSATPVFIKDPLVGSLMERLRDNLKIGHDCSNPLNSASRLGVSFIEWQNEIRPALAEKLEVKPSMVRLETILERYVIPQLYPHLLRQSDFKTNVGVWCEEQTKVGAQYFDSKDGLAVERPRRNMQGVAFRPVVVLD